MGTLVALRHLSNWDKLPVSSAGRTALGALRCTGTQPVLWAYSDVGCAPVTGAVPCAARSGIIPSGGGCWRNNCGQFERRLTTTVGTR